MNYCKAFMLAVSNQKTFLAMVFTQVVYAGMVLLSKAALNNGMNPLVFVAYRQSIATLVLAPFAFAFERENTKTKVSPLSFSIFCKIFFLALCGLTVSTDLFYLALSFTSATFASAIINTIPIIAFIVATLLRLEKVDWSTMYGRLKILGVIFSVGGAMVLSLYRGPALKFLHLPAHAGSTPTSHVELERNKKLIEGAVLMLVATIAWSVWLVLQAEMLKVYPAKLRLTTLQFLLSAVQSGVAGVAFERNLSSWKLAWDIQIVSLVYSGVFVTGVSYGLQIWCIEKKGPFYVAMFSPLSLLITAICSVLLWAELLNCGSVLGGISIVGGLYCLLWGKSKEGNQVMVILSETPKEKPADVERG